MQALDTAIDTEPTIDNIRAMVASTIRNRQAFNELQSYNNNKVFVYEHPLLINHKQLSDLELLFKANPAAFFDEQYKAKQSIIRYESQIKNNKYKNEAELKNWLELIGYYNNKISLMIEVLKKKAS